MKKDEILNTPELASQALLSAMRRTLKVEIDGLSALADSFGEEAAEIARLVAGLDGRLICAGVGKSGHVARKIAATLASTGTPAQFVHPSEASHGDLGMITTADAVLALSKSGETRELSDLIAYCRRFAVPLIAMTAGADSTLARGADRVFLMPQAAEACGETRAPTTSTTMMMAAGDALAVALIEARGFTANDFARFHPGGALGAALAAVSDLMHAGSELPLVDEGASMGDALIEMSEKGFGIAGAVRIGELQRRVHVKQASGGSRLRQKVQAHALSLCPVVADVGDEGEDGRIEPVERGVFEIGGAFALGPAPRCRDPVDRLAVAAHAAASCCKGFHAP